MKVIWTENAKNNLIDYQQNSSITTEGKIGKYINSLIDYVNSLSDFQELGKFLFNKKGFQFRILIYRSHRIFYAIHNNITYILVISHINRNFDTIIKYLKKDFEDMI